MSIVGGKHRPNLHSLRYAVKMYGLVTGNGRGGNAMAWVMSDQTVIVIQNDPSDPEGVKRTVYPVTEVKVSSLGLTASTDTGEISIVQAPCVCGAGPTAIAYPEMPPAGTKLDLQPMVEMPEWVRPAGTL
jgi:hypothetical protein